MGFFLIIFIIFVGGGWLIGKKVGETLFPESDNFGLDGFTEKDNSHTVINNYYVQNNLNVTEDQFEQLKPKS